MYITLLTGSISDGGAERVICNLANYLSEKGHDVDVLVMTETKTCYYLSSKVRVIHLMKNNEKKNSLHNAIVCCFRLARYMRVHCDVDRYVAMLPKTIYMLLSLARNTNAKIIVSERSNPASYPIIRRMLLKHFFKRADSIVFQTEGALSFYKNVIKNIRSTIIPNAINSEFVRKPYDGKKLKRIIAVGRMTRSKNFSLIVDAFAKIAKTFPEYHLAIFGKGPERRNLEKQSESLGVRSRVLFPGYVSNMPEELEKSSLFVLSSNAEGMPNALMEAMSIGLPCISTDCPCGGPRYLIQDGVNGFLVPVGDVRMMAETMKNVLADSDKRDTVGKNAMLIRDSLSPSKIYKRWEEFIIEE